MIERALRLAHDKHIDGKKSTEQDLLPLMNALKADSLLLLLQVHRCQLVRSMNLHFSIGYKFSFIRD